MDVNLAFTAQTVKAFGVERLIHGHTHREAIHQEKGYTHCVGRLAKGLCLNFGSDRKRLSVYLNKEHRIKTCAFVLKQYLIFNRTLFYSYRFC